ncbi:MAG: ATP-binding cassette domain-containing protein [Propionibacteriaceae bacterium]|jgi:ATP-binding cassette subfamily B protein|nr:ATP-binding cassette domain-containing protein [Propionibacteriaceae bacterium]
MSDNLRSPIGSTPADRPAKPDDVAAGPGQTVAADSAPAPARRPADGNTTTHDNATAQDDMATRDKTSIQNSVTTQDDAAAPEPASLEPAETKAAARPRYGPSRSGHGGPMGGHVAEKAVNFGPSLRRLVSYLGPERWRVGIALLLAAASVGLNVAIPKVLGRATDAIFSGVIGKIVGSYLEQSGVDPATVSRQQVLDLMASGQGPAGSLSGSMLDMLSGMDFSPGVGIDFHRLGLIILAAVGLALLSACGQVVTGWIINGVVQRTVYRMREQVADKLDRLPLRYFDSMPRGELLSRVTNDIDNVSQSLQQTLSQLVSAVLMIIGVLVMMLTVSPLLTIVALVTIPLTVVLASVVMKRSQRRFAEMWKATGELNGHIEESYTGHAIVKVFGRHREVEEEFRRKNEELFNAAFSAQALSGVIMPLTGFIGNLGYVVVAVVGGLRVASGNISLGDVQAFIQYNRQFTQPISQIASMANLLQSGVASAERVFEVLDTAEETPDGNTPLPVPPAGRVEFDHVSFSYDPEHPLITDLSLKAEPGQTIAIVGPTGAGKTTLVNLLMRFYDVDGGRITLDGVDTGAVPRAQLRDAMGMVLQDTWLFKGTIRENIAYGRPDASEEDILAAAKTAYVDRFVRSLPEGYDTVIDDEGSNVSVGEKQLLTIARAFLSEPALLILDEATSSVDTRTEVLIQKAMGKLRAGRTSFVIAHRLSTIRDADLILVMEHGDIVEQGDHEQLLAAQGSYWRLYQSQFAGVVEESDN